MIRVSRRSLVIGLVVLILALAGGTAFAAAQQPPAAVTVPSRSLATTPTPIVLQVTPPAGVGATKTTGEGLAITLVQIVKNGPRWLFHFQISNRTPTSLTVRGTSDVHQFVISGVIQTPPYHAEIPLGSPSASEIATNYSDLTTTLQSGGTAQGWLAVDTTNLGFTPVQLLYRYAAVPATACTNPADQSTCHPDTLYQALIWSLR